MASDPKKRGRYYYFYDWVNGKKKWINTKLEGYKEACDYKRRYEGRKASDQTGQLIQNGQIDDLVALFMEHSEANYTRWGHVRNKIAINDFLRICPITYVSELNTLNINKYKLAKLREGNKESSINRAITSLQALGSFAVTAHYADRPLLQGIERYSTPDIVRDRYFSLEEIEVLKNGIISHPLKTILHLCLYAALRPHEAINLKWSHILQDEIVIWPKKTKKSNPNKETVPLNAHLAAYLKTLTRKHEYICAYDDGSLVRPETASELMSRRMKELGFEGCTAYTLRHTCLSWAAMKMKWLSVVKLARHKNPKMTMVYAHLSPEFKGEDINKLPY